MSCRADGACDFAVHPAHDVHVHRAALKRNRKEREQTQSICQLFQHSYDRVKDLRLHLKVGRAVRAAYQSSHAELQAKHQIELLAFEPVHRIRVLGDSQRLASDATQQRHEEET